jgi:hypothetical protein
MERRPSPRSWIASHPLYGAGERIPIGATAFGIRSRHQMLGIYSVFEPGDETAHAAWADETEAALTPCALPSAYPNYFGADRPNQAALGFRTKYRTHSSAEETLRSRGHLPCHLAPSGCAPPRKTLNHRGGRVPCARGLMRSTECCCAFLVIS